MCIVCNVSRCYITAEATTQQLQDSRSLVAAPAALLGVLSSVVLSSHSHRDRLGRKIALIPSRSALK